MFHITGVAKMPTFTLGSVFLSHVYKKLFCKSSCLLTPHRVGIFQVHLEIPEQCLPLLGHHSIITVIGTLICPLYQGRNHRPVSVEDNLLLRLPAIQGMPIVVSFYSDDRCSCSKINSDDSFYTHTHTSLSIIYLYFPNS